MIVQQQLAQGIAHHNAGELGEAARCYRSVLQLDPSNVDALNLMSVLATQAGQPQLGVDLARQAIEGDDSYFAPYVSLGNALQALGDFPGAVDAFQRSVALHGDSAEAYCNLASALNACGRFEDANDAAVKALVLNPGLAAAYNNFGNALVGMGSPFEAIECYEKCLSLHPDFADAWHNLGNAQMAVGNCEEALGAFARALQLEESASRFHNLGNAFLALNQFEEAARCFAQAIEMDASFIDSWMNLSVALKSLGRLEEAEAVQRDVVALAPDDAEAHFNLAVLLLQQGKWAEGWSEYEWRWGLPSFRSFSRDFGRPRWDGSDCHGKTVLISSEQGYGDAIQFARFIPLVAERVGKVVVEVRPGLERLMASVAGCTEVVALGEELPPFDLHIPLMSLPGTLGLTLDRLPAQVPYVKAPPGVLAPPSLRDAVGLKIGVAWAGKVSRRDNFDRSCRLDDFLPLAELPGVHLFSLQVGPDAGLGAWAERANLHDLAPFLTDFAATAAAMAELDLVVTVDTSVAHLAGALGKPVWVLLSRPSNAFLWMEERADSPWYASARLFRQPAPRDWSGAIRQVHDELSRLTG